MAISFSKPLPREAADGVLDREILVAQIAKSERPSLFPSRRRISRSDAIMAALGVGLAIVCAVFPWYIFYNQEQFGVRAMKFQGNPSARAPSSLSPQPTRVGQPMDVRDVPVMDLDLLSTATVPGPSEVPEVIELEDQPFPADTVEYQLIHVANGRAMIEDEDGIWVVQPGSILPDASRVATIEQRDGKWVLVTTFDRTVELAP
ncbi:MAG: hypothetical protein MEQ84_10085 [Mesorhizobium sp.]|nr:hypothetical protein [Mesorhizobium sp.]